MNLPQAVIEAGKRSDELIAAHQASLEQANADQGQPPAEQPPQPQAPTRAQPATEETADQMGLATLSDEQTAQQRLRTLQGKYSAEVPRMAQEIRELKQMVQQQAGQLEQQRMSAQPQPGPVSSAIDFDALNREFPEEIVSPIKSLSGQVDQLTQVNAELMNRLNQMQGNVEQIGTDTANSNEADFWTRLGELYPQYQEVNGNKEFKRFLLGFRQDGQQWNVMLRDAQANLNAAGVASVFHAFEGAMQNQSQANPHPQPPSVPDNVNAANPPAQPTTWTRAKVKQFYDAMATGELLRQGMTAKEIAEIDNDITRAHAEGRIR